MLSLERRLSEVGVMPEVVRMVGLAYRPPQGSCCCGFPSRERMDELARMQAEAAAECERRGILVAMRDAQIQRERLAVKYAVERRMADREED